MNKWNELFLIVGIVLGALFVGQVSGCSTESAYKRHQAHTDEWLQCAADRRGSRGCV